GKTKEEVVDEFRLPYFAFKFHHKHFLISAYPIRNEMLDPVKKVKGTWSYTTGLYNVADFIREFPENEKSHVHQFNLSKLDRTRLLHIW
ncbi:MAG: 2',3'-cyclic-nucleotide 2'-phosphodiesterase, partial [Lactobacillus sp.]